MRQVIPGLSILFLAFILLASGCSTSLPAGTNYARGQDYPGGATPGSNVSLEGTTWHLVVFHTASGRTAGVLQGTEITAFIDGSGKITGKSGCNQYTAACAVSSGNLSIGTPVSTGMYCRSPDGTMTQEAVYLAMLQRVAYYRIGEGILTMGDKNGNPLLTFSVTKPAVA